MIFNALLFAVGVGIVSADFTCPDGIVTCAEGKACCFQSGSGYSCCDHKPDDDAKLIPGIPSVWQRLPNQSLPSTPQVQHALYPFILDLYNYCPDTRGKRKCCKDPYNLDSCRPYGQCCTYSESCCMPGTGNCCSSGKRSWCCKTRCGPYEMTCYSGAEQQAAQGLAVMVAVALAVFKFARI